MEKIKILFLYSCGGYAGIARNLSILVSNLDLSKFDVSVVFIGDSKDLSADLRRAPGITLSPNIHFSLLEEGGKFSFRILNQLKNEYHSHKFQILSCHGYKAKFYAVLLKLLTKGSFKLVTVAHGWVSAGVRVQLYYLLDKLLIHFCNKAVLVSQSQYEQLRGFCIPSQKLSVINNGIDAFAFAQRKSVFDLRRKIGLGPDTLIVGMLSRLEREKDLETALVAFSKLKAEFSKAALVIAGEGSEAKRLQNRCADLGIDRSVHLIGFQAEVASYLSQLDIFLSTSRKEGMPNSVLEAQAVQVPCVLSRIGGHIELVTEGSSGYLFEVGNSEQIVSKLIRLMKDEKLREQVGQAGFESVSKHFSVDKRIAEFEKLYANVISN